MAMVSVTTTFFSLFPTTHASRLIRCDGLRVYILLATDHHIHHEYYAKTACRTNHHQGARHGHAVPGSKPLRVRAAGYDQ